MNEQVNKEIAKAAEKLELPLEEVETKWSEICDTHGITEENWKLGLSLFRQWFSGKNAYKDVEQPATEGGNSLVKKAVGFFLSVDAARDMAAMQNERIKNEYQADAQETYRLGRVAIAHMLDAEGYEIKRMFKGEEQTRTVVELPKNNFEVDTGRFIIPLDNMPSYGTRENPSYGKPLPHEQYRMAGVFLGEVDGNNGVYYFSYKGPASKEFTPKTFTLVEMDVIPDSNNDDRIYGFKQGTLESLVVKGENEPTNVEMQNYVMEHAGGHYSPLIDIGRYHNQTSDKRYAEKFVITDGSVSSVNMTPNKFGTRRVTITDLNSDFDYDGGSWAGTTCWVPPHIDIDFGIGSSVVVVGRTSQGRNDDGSFGDVNLNVSGVLVIENRGSVVEPFEADEEDLDWF